jgi:hypothetical protein
MAAVALCAAAAAAVAQSVVALLLAHYPSSFMTVLVSVTVSLRTLS